MTGLLYGQCLEIVPNGSFEDFTALPDDDCDWFLASGWNNAATSSDCNSNNGTPDYFHLQGIGAFSSLPVNYFAELNPFDGQAIMGLAGRLSLVANAREYIAIQLNSPLVIGENYTLRFSLSCGVPQVGGFYVNGWGAKLSVGQILQTAGTNQPIASNGNEFLVPGVFSSENWQTFTFDFTADQAYTYITLGNYLNDAQQNTVSFGAPATFSVGYVFLDAVSITPQTNTPLELTLNNSEACPGETITLNANVTGGTAPYSFTWSNAPGINESNISITANQSTSYQVTVTDCNYNSISSTGNIVVPEFDFNLGADTDLCAGPVTLGDVLTQALGYLWNTQATSPQITVEQSGNYFLSIEWACGIVSDSILILDCIPAFLVDLGNNQLICANESITINPVIIGGTAPYTYQWNTGSTESSITISTPVTDTVILTITDANGLSVSDSLIISVIPPLTNIELGENLFICPNESIQLDATSLNASSYAWSNGSINATITVSDPGIYSVIVSSPCGILSDTVEVFSLEIFIPPFVTELHVCEGESINIGPEGDEFLLLSWLDDSDLSFPRNVAESGIYSFIAVDVCGERTFSVSVNQIICNCDIYFPNSFTPNGDGLNDTFGPEYNCVFAQYDFYVFNRWGQQVFQTSNPNQKWDGTFDNEKVEFSANDVFVWQLSARPDQQLENKSPFRLSGTVKLLK